MQKRPLDPAEAVFFADIQKLVHRRETPLSKVISKICAVDAAYRDSRVVASASVFDNGRLVEDSHYSGNCSFPYIPGLFYMREGPFVVEAVRRLKVRPQLVCFDAHGAAHPRSAGLATICGMILGIPSIGIAKSPLIGTVVSHENAGRREDLIVYNDKTVGLVVVTNSAKRFWSPGYSVNLSELRRLIRDYASTCLLAMAESHRAARTLIPVGRKEVWR